MQSAYFHKFRIIYQHFALLVHLQAVDWWSLGILLYELTVGIPPFYSPHVTEMYNKIQHGVLKFPPTLSTPCKDVCVHMRYLEQ